MDFVTIATSDLQPSSPLRASRTLTFVVCVDSGTVLEEEQVVMERVLEVVALVVMEEVLEVVALVVLAAAVCMVEAATLQREPDLVSNVANPGTLLGT